MAKLRRVRKPDKSLYGYVFECPGCKMPHVITTDWEFNGDLERPTFKPSYLQHATSNGYIPRCHLFIEDGKLKFLNDSDHELAGETVELVEMVES